jgi:hypothetical protein
MTIGERRSVEAINFGRRLRTDRGRPTAPRRQQSRHGARSVRSSPRASRNVPARSPGRSDVDVFDGFRVFLDELEP